MDQMIEMFHVKQIVAVGRKAEETLNKLNITAHRVRHPAQGGKKEFVEGIKKLERSFRDAKNSYKSGHALL